jgi:hypothetical protein
MQKYFRTPHTFDMNDYYTGKTVVLGGSEYEREEREISSNSPETKNTSVNTVPELDWSFLKKNLKNSKS